MSHAERVTQVFHPFVAVEPGLGGGVADALQGVQDGFSRAPGDEAREDFGLVELAFAEADRMEGDGNESVEGLGGNALVFHGFHEPVRQGVTQVKVPVVFKAVQELTHHPAAAKAGDGAFEMEPAVPALVADEFTGDGAVEWLGTLPAKWCFDP